MTTPVFRLLGHPEWVQGAGRSPLPTGQVGRFLAHLAYQGEWLGREELVFLFLPDQPDSVADANLRKLLQRARKDAAGIEVNGDLVRWSVPTDVQAWHEALAGQDWEAAFDLYRGPLLAGLDGSSCGR